MIKKMYKNNLEFKKDLLNRLKYINNYELEVKCYSEDDNDNVMTDLEVDIYLNGEYVDTATYECIEEPTINDCADWWDMVERQRSLLRKDKQKLHKYLIKHFSNVKLCEDYVA
ncbi:MAG: hypothetical protein RSC24_06800 [Clostridium sp.]